MRAQEVGQRVLVLGAGMLLIGSLGVGSASATDYYSDNSCVRVSTYHHPHHDGSTDRSTDSSTDSTTDSSTDNPLDPITDPITDTPLDPITDPVTDPATDTPLDPVTDPATDTPLDPVTDPATDTPLDPVTDPATDTPLDPVTDPITGGGGTEEGTVIPPISPSGGSSSESSGGGLSSVPSGGLPLTQGIRSAAPPTDAGTDADLDESEATLTTTDEGDNYDSGYRSSGYHSRVVCYVDNSVGHYYYHFRPVGEVYATQVRSVPVGGVATGN